MFLCGKCHTEEGCFHPFKSHGACEGCGKVAECVDCKSYKKKPTPKKKKCASCGGKHWWSTEACRMAKKAE